MVEIEIINLYGDFVEEKRSIMHKNVLINLIKNISEHPSTPFEVLTRFEFLTTVSDLKNIINLFLDSAVS